MYLNFFFFLLQKEYHTRLAEDSRWPKSVLTVTATDPDTREHGEVSYTLGGEGALLFVINETTGEVSFMVISMSLDFFFFER